MGRKYDKLVRDDIPEIIEENDETPQIHVADGEEYARRLRAKLDEEVAEYHEDPSLGELADILEVVHALGEHHGVSAAELRRRREAKADERGRFADGIVLERVSSE
ncbi:Predicted house-cleaning noncanonical NTP pyrophosphatase, all-alpha NTP-PPase (MazG) superfamily [Halovenus aranensis]|uniref:Predicted house-cleaning noncanonical NTP pyrophosphatase, all-alpha NTP-PPase (MazG) superfamily n=1 Tax=Halovenus aranensis TaxID=890420 RepID=A0A1G8UYG0_9EURY|nr:nucleoside triphosphate pyrophosphohydrolase [Halovenus aranensis]SDJ58823.1 Predicted house-cleaning noncanonical NTP pyrophosphatase, all-alpha NTP-PPase (MazG) superfamily [Halovenus aranensis]